MVVAYALGLVAVLVFAWFGVPFLWRRLAESRLSRRCRQSRSLVLTYDDGPGPQLTPRLLDLLRQHQAGATFFLLGRHAEARPDLARRVLAEGHEIGSHTRDHSNAWKCDPFTAARDFARGASSVQSLGGDARLFRPPFGKLTLAGLLDGSLRGLRFGWWTIDSRDSWRRRPIDEVVAEIARKGGGVVLMHDFDRYGGPAGDGVDHVEHVLALTRRILLHAREHGLRVCRLRDLQPGPGRGA